MSLEAYSETRKNRLKTQSFTFDFASEYETKDDLTSEEKMDIKEYYSSKEKVSHNKNIDDLLNDLES
jgi:hypothetical protein